MTRDRLWPAVLVGWALAAAVLILVSAKAIAGIRFPDPDDAMRLLEVRDWLGGQSWWDVAQHRLNGGDFPMHWSRLVDLPLAAVMVALDPLLGAPASTRVAMVAVPLLTLLAVTALAAALTRRLIGPEAARYAVLLTPLSAPLLAQLRPMRIDHHGWQVALALAATVALVGRPGRPSGLAIGAALAALVTVSLEGLPIAVAIAALTGLAAAIDRRRRDQAVAALAGLAAGVVLLHAATRGPGMWTPACDAISPGWIAALGVAAAGGVVALLADFRTPAMRIAALGAAGAAGAATLAWVAPACLGGPFATLDPLVYHVWYRNVAEGLPLWRQAPDWIMMTAMGPVIGLIGSIAALRGTTGDARTRWLLALGVQLASYALGLLVARAGATANALAVPGSAYLLMRLLTRARLIVSPPRRVAATAVTLLAASPGLAACIVYLALTIAGSSGSAAAARAPGRPQCSGAEDMDALAALPPAILFAPLDLSPELLAATGHRAIAAGYHRNGAAIHVVMSAFLGSPDHARRLVLAAHAGYVVGCPGVNESETYRKLAPNGFWARLDRGERFDWLRPVPIRGSPALAWQVVDPAVRPLSPPGPRP